MPAHSCVIRLVPIWLGHDSDDEENEEDAPLLVDAGTARSRALPAAEGQRLLTEAGEYFEGDQQATDNEDEEKEGLGGDSGALLRFRDEDGALVEVDEVMAGEVVEVVDFPKWVRDFFLDLSRCLTLFGSQTYGPGRFHGTQVAPFVRKGMKLGHQSSGVVGWAVPSS